MGPAIDCLAGPFFCPERGFYSGPTELPRFLRRRPAAGPGTNAGTSWPTSCYSSRYMGGKQGVGLVLTFDDLAQQAITVDVQTGPYQVDFFASDADTIPTTFEAWGAPLGSTAFANDPETVVSPVPPTPTRHLLILLKELGQDGTCSDTNPYRGRLGEIAVVG